MRSITIWVMVVFVVVICFGLPEADATIYFDDGGQHTIDYAIHDTVYVDYGTPDAGTQLELVDTGSIDGYLKSYENSQVTVSGGKIGNSLWTFGNSQATVSGGEMFGLKSCDNSQVTVLGGEIGYSLWAYDNSEVTVSGGDILYWLGALENSQVTVSGGKIGYGVYAGNPPGWDTSILTFKGTDFAVNGNPLEYGDFASDYAVPGADPGGNPCLTGTLTGTLANGGTLNKTFYIFDDADITFAIHEPATLVAVDIKPGSCPNPVNVKSSGVLPIAILGTDDYDVTTIDPTSVRLAGVEPLRSSIEDVAGPASEQGGTEIVIYESHVFTDPLPITLDRVNIDTSSIVVTDSAGLDIYTSGDDYTITEINGRVRLNMTTLGTIPPNVSDGQTLFVDYVYFTCECTTQGPDGFLDLTLKFKTQRIVEAVGDVNDGDVRVLTLTGVLFDPMPFETLIEGADCILIRGKHKPINPADINKDGVVDAADFAIFTQNWLQSSLVKD